MYRPVPGVYSILQAVEDAHITGHVCITRPCTSGRTGPAHAGDYWAGTGRSGRVQTDYCRRITGHVQAADYRACTGPNDRAARLSARNHWGGNEKSASNDGTRPRKDGAVKNKHQVRVAAGLGGGSGGGRGGGRSRGEQQVPADPGTERAAGAVGPRAGAGSSLASASAGTVGPSDSDISPPSSVRSQ